MEELEKELNYLFIELKRFDPSTDEYAKVRAQISAIIKDQIELNKASLEAKNAKKERIIKWVQVGGGIIATPIIGYFINRKLIRVVGEVEQMEIFTTTPGKKIIGKMF